MSAFPFLTLPILLFWTIGLIWSRLLAIPLAVFAFVCVLFVAVETPAEMRGVAHGSLPDLALISPNFSASAALSIALPLYLVIMAGQNVPGFSVLELNKYPVSRPFLLRGTGIVSLGIALFGAIPVNMSAITVSMMAGEDAGKDPDGRYWAAVVSGLCYVAFACVAGIVTSLAVLAPPEIITAVAGLALIPAFVASISAALSDPEQIEAPALTFLVSASGISLFVISSAVWGIVFGAVI